MIPRVREWAHRGEVADVPDSVDDHAALVTAILWPDDPDLPDPDLTEEN